MYFNSQPHEEADGDATFKNADYQVHFNSQPHEEADHAKMDRLYDKSISTHSLTKRLTTTETNRSRNGSYFNSQPHEEADSKQPCVDSGRNNFNSQPHEEADGNRPCRFKCPRNISTHSLTKRLTVADDDGIRISNTFQLTASRRG